MTDKGDGGANSSSKGTKVFDSKTAIASTSISSYDMFRYAVQKMYRKG